MTAILLGLAVAVIVIYAGILIAAFSGEDEPEQDKEIKFEDLKEGQHFWGICPYYNELSVFKRWGNHSISVHCDDTYDPDEVKIIELIKEPKGYENHNDFN